MGPGALSTILTGLPNVQNENLLVGYDSSDDACVYKVSDDTAVIQTVDFFTPIVDDPYLFGQIAAANALSDVYAMGGLPKLAMNLLCVPNCLSLQTIRKILEGGHDKAVEAGCVIAGGHTIQDNEPKYGLCVTGFVHPDRILKNVGARPGDVLVLTKPIGSGVLATAAKANLCAQEHLEEAWMHMATLNAKAGEAVIGTSNVHACTDVTGFSFLGHLHEMLDGKLSCVIHARQVPFIPEAADYADEFLLTAAGQRNRNFVGPFVRFEGVPFAMEEILFDPQTSGGLLIALSPEQAPALLADLQAIGLPARIVGELTQRTEPEILVQNN